MKSHKVTIRAVIEKDIFIEPSSPEMSMQIAQNQYARNMYSLNDFDVKDVSFKMEYPRKRIDRDSR